MPHLTPTNSMEELVALSRRYGSDPAYCLAGGGNTSLKSGDRLWVKASGCSLGEIAADGFVEMDRHALAGMLECVYSDDASDREAQFIERMMSARTEPAKGQRPSVETLIHELIPRRFVVHTHPAKVNALTCCVGGEALAQSWLGSSVIWQPYVDPGVTLAQSLKGRLANAEAQDGPIVVLLENHGLIVAADSAHEIDQATQALIDLIDRNGASIAAEGFDGQAFPDSSQCLDVHQRAAQQLFYGNVAVSERSDEIRALTGSEGGRAAALAGPLTPDQIVYCRAMPMWIDSPADTASEAKAQWHEGLERYEAEHGDKPWVVLLAGAGMVAIRESEGLAQTTCDVYCDAAQIYRYAGALGGVQPMAPRDVAFIENWEVESYRRAVAAGELSQSA
ncbi:MAG: class II aldolase/adducin family protein [Phycisphaeraceae bacterium]|nr:class II aldolase/adducin family protein [Phycisphaeraceae bacterium]